MNEQMVYGSRMFSPQPDGKTILYNARAAKTQLPGFTHLRPT